MEELAAEKVNRTIMGHHHRMFERDSRGGKLPTHCTKCMEKFFKIIIIIIMSSEVRMFLACAVPHGTIVETLIPIRGWGSPDFSCLCDTVQL